MIKMLLKMIPLMMVVLIFAFSSQDKSYGQKPALSKELYIYNWEDYFAPSTIEKFEKQYGVKVHLDTFEDEEVMISTIQSDPTRYDIIVASDYTLRDLVEMRLLAPLNHQNIPNLKNLAPQFRHPEYDPQLTYAVPYLWGTTGIAVNRKHIKDSKISWSVLWDPKNKGKISMLNNMDEITGAALKRLGYSINSLSSQELEKARIDLLKQKELLVGYLDPVLIREKLASEEIWAAHLYSGDSSMVREKNDSIEYVIPEEGGFIWVDNFAIPRDAQHKYTAEIFLNFILEAQRGAEIANYLWFASCNIAAQAYTNPEILQDPSVYPSDDILRKCEFFRLQGDPADMLKSQQLRNKIWAELMQ
jgi:spermidine/putrescine transport system substrate-binding protein